MITSLKHIFETFLFVRYLRGTSNYLERMTLFDPTHTMSMANPVAIGVESLKIDSGCSLKKEFIELIFLNS